jgi:aminoglycoside phosphotransferase family enzyme/predicted kinase
MATAPPGTTSADSQVDVVAFLESGDAFEAREARHRIDTHCSSVFLSGDRAWKLKRAVKFGYLDFSTPERRRKVLEAELRLNRRTAPQLYRAVHPIMQTPDGRLTIGGVSEILDPDQARLLGKRLLDLTGELTPLLDSRGLSSRIRHARGDLHLANIALIDDVPTLFDCLEFSTELATIDIQYDLAFLLMDLWHSNLRAEANIVFNRYLDLSPADEDAIALMPLLLAVRAAIRAHVLAAQSMRAGRDRAIAANARTYLDLTLGLIRPVQLRLIAIGGLSGTGKSSLARILGGDIGRAPGARIFRNDVLRKRLAGLPPETRLSRSGYSEQAAALVYDSSDTMAAAALSLGQSVIADGVFARRDQRLKIEAVARKVGAGFDGLWLEAPGETRVARVGSRGADASDADTAVAQAQADLAVGNLGGWQRISAAGPLDEVATEARHALKLANCRTTTRCRWTPDARHSPGVGS